MKEKDFIKPKLGISSCLLGNRVRFDGGHKRDLFLSQGFGEFVEWVVVCPEFEVGMGVPREPVRLVGQPEAPEMIAEKSARNWTAAINQFAAQRARQLSKLNLSGFVFKKNSPSCGMERVKIFNPKGPPFRQGRGLFAAVIMKELPLIPCEEEGRLSDPKLRENFIERVFAYHRWCGAMGQKRSISKLVEFHTKHKFLLLAHSETHYRRLGRVVAAAKQIPLGEVYREYGALFMQALALHASAKKHANVLDHMLGYFSKQLCADERQEIVELIGDFRRGLVPLIVPITLVRHYAKKYQVQYLLAQTYLDPSPKELMLRNHV